MKQCSRLFCFYTLLVTQTLSLIGSRMTAVALGIWIYRQTGLTSPLLLIVFFREAPGMVAGALAGVWVDRWDRRLTMALSDAGQALGSLLLLVGFRAGATVLWHLYAVAFLQGTFAVFQGPALYATVSELIPDRQRDRANGLLELPFPLASILAPALAGMLYSATGIGTIIALDLGTFVLASLVAASLPIPRLPSARNGQPGHPGWVDELREGFAYFRQRPVILQFVLYQGWMWFALNGPLELALPYAIAITGDEQQAGWVMSLMSLGALLGSLLVVTVGALRPRTKVIALGMLFTGVMFIFYGLARTTMSLGLSLFLLMVPLPVSNALFRSIVQTKTPPRLQGRAFAALEQFFLVGSTASFLLTGPLVDRVLNPVSTGTWARHWLMAGSQAGISLLLLMTGGLILSSTAIVFGQQPIRNLETILPDCDVFT